jgi:hypothetical protein
LAVLPGFILCSFTGFATLFAAGSRGKEGKIAAGMQQ